MNRGKLKLLSLPFLFVAIVLVPIDGFTQVPFYQGKTLTIIHGRSAGGAGDFRARAVAPFLHKYIPGNPTIVHEYMDGGGVVASAVLGETGVQYDLDKLPFVGSPYSESHYLLVTRREASFSNLEKLRAASGVRLGSQSVGHTNYTLGRIMAWLLGLKEIKDVTGFSNPERDVALLRGEIDAIATSDDGILRKGDWLDKGLIDLHVIYAIPREKKHPRFDYLPKIDGFAKTERERKVLTLFRTFRLAGSPFIIPPATPKDRMEIIKDALRKSFKDADFFKEYRKLASEDPTPLMPEANEKAIRELPRDRETLELYKKFAGAGPLPPR